MVFSLYWTKEFKILDPGSKCLFFQSFLFELLIHVEEYVDSYLDKDLHELPNI